MVIFVSYHALFKACSVNEDGQHSRAIWHIWNCCIQVDNNNNNRSKTQTDKKHVLEENGMNITVRKNHKYPVELMK